MGYFTKSRSRNFLSKVAQYKFLSRNYFIFNASFSSIIPDLYFIDISIERSAIKILSEIASPFQVLRNFHTSGKFSRRRRLKAKKAKLDSALGNVFPEAGKKSGLTRGDKWVKNGQRQDWSWNTQQHFGRPQGHPRVFAVARKPRPARPHTPGITSLQAAHSPRYLISPAQFNLH